MFINLLPGKIAFATNDTESIKKIDNLITEDEFFKLVKDNKYYKQHKEYFISEQPELFNPIINDANLQTGYILQYELSYGFNDSEDVIKIPSLLIFAYDSSLVNNELQVILIDYSKTLKDDSIGIKHFNEDIDLDININEEKYLDEYFSKIKQDNNELMNVYQETMCWKCTKYVEGGGYFISEWCGLIVGKTIDAALEFLEEKGISFSIFGKVLLGIGGVVLSCYVPKYKICDDGYWSTICPVPESIPNPIN